MRDWFAPIRLLMDVDHIQRSVRLMVVGGGRVGWSFILMAINHGVRWIRLIEPDWTEPRNFASRFSEAAVGYRKIDYVQHELRRRSSRISIQTAAVTLSAQDPGAFLEWLPWSTHVGLFIDDFEVASALARLAYPERACIYASVLENGRTGEAAWSLPGQTPCLQCTARLSEKQGARGGQTMLLDVDRTVDVAVRQFLGLALVGRRGFELFGPYVHPRFPWAIVVNRPGGFLDMRDPDIPSGVRLVEVVDGHGHGPTCPTCRGYRP